ncbi:hypothetical protein PSHT_07717, partial [Puccinia striiformis]
HHYKFISSIPSSTTTSKPRHRDTSQQHGHIRIARTAPKRTDYHLAASFLFITATAALNLAFPKLSDEPTHPRPSGLIPLPITQLKNILPKLIHLSYFNPDTGKYQKGWDDLYFIAFWPERASMKLVWNPLGSMMGLAKAFRRARLDFGLLLSLLVHGNREDLSFRTGIAKFSAHTPNRSRHEHTAILARLSQHFVGCSEQVLLFSQIAFWFNRLLSCRLKNVAKTIAKCLHNQGFPQLTLILSLCGVSDHIVTVFLVCGSYATNFTGIGTAVHTTMDLSDILLAFAKMLNYLQVGTIGDASFLAFVFSWIYTRHYVLIRIIFAIYTDLPQDMNLPASDRSFMDYILVLLTALETIIMIWLYMILKVVWKVARGQAPEDTSRTPSQDTDDEDTVGKANYHKIGVTSEKQPLLKASRHRPSRKMQ